MIDRVFYKSVSLLNYSNSEEEIMKKGILVLTTILALSSVAYADSNDKNYEVRGYHNGRMMGPGYGGYMMGGYMMGSGYGGHMMGPGYDDYMMGSGYHRGMYGDDRYMPQRRLTPEEEKTYFEMREKSFEIHKKYSIEIRRKQLELESELMKEKPNWEKIEKLNGEIAILESKVKTEMMKVNYDK